MSDNFQVQTSLGSANTQSSGIERGLALSTLASGLFRGESVTRVAHPQSLFESALEELTFAAARSDSDKNKRRIQQRQRVNDHIEPINAYLNAVSEIEKQEMKNFPFTLLQQNIDSYEQLQAYLQSQFQDVSSQYMAMVVARQKLGQEHRHEVDKGGLGYSALLSLLDESIAQYEHEQGPQIRAGINIASIATEEHKKTGLNDIQSLKDFYRDSVLDYGGLSETYRRVMDDYGNKDLPLAISYLLKGLSADLTAQGSSIDKVLLRQIVADMSKLKVVNSIYTQALALLEKIRL